MGSRYLGLDFNLPLLPSKEGALSPEKRCEENINWELIVRSTCYNVGNNLNVAQSPSLGGGKGKVLVARNDEAFSFLYQETLDRLSTLGSVEYFDPAADNCQMSIINFSTSPAVIPRNISKHWLPMRLVAKPSRTLPNEEGTSLPNVVA